MWSDISSTIGLLGISPYFTLAATFFSVILFRQLKKGRHASGNPNGLPLPPGPKGYPLFGNLFDMPVDKPWVVYDEWRKTYGKTFIIDGLLPQITDHWHWHFRWYDIPQCSRSKHFNFKFLGSHRRPPREKVFKLLRQKAFNYVMWTVCIAFLSPQTWITCQKTNRSWCRIDSSKIAMPFMPYGPWWRKHRKSFHEYFHRDAVTKFQPIQRQEVRAFLRRLLVTPHDFFYHIRQ